MSPVDAFAHRRLLTIKATEARVARSRPMQLAAIQGSENRIKDLMTPLLASSLPPTQAIICSYQQIGDLDHSDLLHSVYARIPHPLGDGKAIWSNLTDGDQKVDNNIWRAPTSGRSAPEKARMIFGLVHQPDQGSGNTPRWLFQAFLHYPVQLRCRIFPQ
jgi:hypothetical protein